MRNFPLSLTATILGFCVCMPLCLAQDSSKPDTPASAGASASDEKVMVGGRMIKLPAPAGFERIDGREPAVDKVVEAALPTTNRYLARFDPPAKSEGGKDVSTDGRSFNAQVLRSLESKEIGTNTFRQAKDSMKSELDQLSKNIEAEFAKQTGKIGGQIKDAAGVDAALSIGNVAVLGYFDDTPESLGFSMAMNTEVKVAEQTIKSRDVASALVVSVNGRLIYLYATSGYQSDADRQWAEKAVMEWRDKVVAANPRLEGPDVRDERAYRLGKIIGTGLGVAVGVGLGLWILRKFRRKA